MSREISSTAPSVKGYSADHCILWVRTNDKNSLLHAMQPRKIRRLQISDRDSPEEIALAEQRRRLGLRLQRLPYRYYGVLSSSKYIKGVDIAEHVEWIFSNLRSKFNLNEWRMHGAEYGLSHGWWGGLGTGHGLTIPPRLGEILLEHNVGLEISLYA